MRYVDTPYGQIAIDDSTEDGYRNGARLVEAAAAKSPLSAFGVSQETLTFLRQTGGLNESVYRDQMAKNGFFF